MFEVASLVPLTHRSEGLRPHPRSRHRRGSLDSTRKRASELVVVCSHSAQLLPPCEIAGQACGVPLTARLRNAWPTLRSPLTILHRFRCRRPEPVPPESLRRGVRRSFGFGMDPGATGRIVTQARPDFTMAVDLLRSHSRNPSTSGLFLAGPGLSIQGALHPRCCPVWLANRGVHPCHAASLVLARA